MSQSVTIEQSTMKDVTTCTICNLSFTGLLKKKIHEQQVHIWIFQCDVCQTKFKTNEDLETHRLIHNKKISEQKEEESPVKKLKKKKLKQKVTISESSLKSIVAVECSVCEELFKSESELRDHTQINHPKTVEAIECSICFELFKTEEEVEEHVKLQHPTDSTLECSETTEKEEPSSIRSVLKSTHNDNVIKASRTDEIQRKYDYLLCKLQKFKSFQREDSQSITIKSTKSKTGRTKKSKNGRRKQRVYDRDSDHGKEMVSDVDTSSLVEVEEVANSTKLEEQNTDGDHSAEMVSEEVETTYPLQEVEEEMPAVDADGVLLSNDHDTVSETGDKMVKLSFAKRTILQTEDVEDNTDSNEEPIPSSSVAASKEETNDTRDSDLESEESVSNVSIEEEETKAEVYATKAEEPTEVVPATNTDDNFGVQVHVNEELTQVDAEEVDSQTVAKVECEMEDRDAREEVNNKVKDKNSEESTATDVNEIEGDDPDKKKSSKESEVIEFKKRKVREMQEEHDRLKKKLEELMRKKASKKEVETNDSISAEEKRRLENINSEENDSAEKFMNEEDQKDTGIIAKLSGMDPDVHNEAAAQDTVTFNQQIQQLVTSSKEENSPIHKPKIEKVSKAVGPLPCSGMKLRLKIPITSEVETKSTKLDEDEAHAEVGSETTVENRIIKEEECKRKKPLSVKLRFKKPRSKEVDLNSKAHTDEKDIASQNVEDGNISTVPQSDCVKLRFKRPVVPHEANITPQETASFTSIFDIEQDPAPVTTVHNPPGPPSTRSIPVEVEEHKEEIQEHEHLPVFPGEKLSTLPEEYPSSLHDEAIPGLPEECGKSPNDESVPSLPEEDGTSTHDDRVPFLPEEYATSLDGKNSPTLAEENSTNLPDNSSIQDVESFNYEEESCAPPSQAPQSLKKKRRKPHWKEIKDSIKSPLATMKSRRNSKHSRLREDKSWKYVPVKKPASAESETTPQLPSQNLYTEQKQDVTQALNLPTSKNLPILPAEQATSLPAEHLTYIPDEHSTILQAPSLPDNSEETRVLERLKSLPLLTVQSNSSMSQSITPVYTEPAPQLQQSQGSQLYNQLGQEFSIEPMTTSPFEELVEAVETLIAQENINNVDYEHTSDAAVVNQTFSTADSVSDSIPPPPVKPAKKRGRPRKDRGDEDLRPKRKYRKKEKTTSPEFVSSEELHAQTIPNQTLGNDSETLDTSLEALLGNDTPPLPSTALTSSTVWTPGPQPDNLQEPLQMDALKGVQHQAFTSFPGDPDLNTDTTTTGEEHFKVPSEPKKRGRPSKDRGSVKRGRKAKKPDGILQSSEPDGILHHPAASHLAEDLNLATFNMNDINGMMEGISSYSFSGAPFGYTEDSIYYEHKDESAMNSADDIPLETLLVNDVGPSSDAILNNSVQLESVALPWNLTTDNFAVLPLADNEEVVQMHSEGGELISNVNWSQSVVNTQPQIIPLERETITKSKFPKPDNGFMDYLSDSDDEESVMDETDLGFLEPLSDSDDEEENNNATLTEETVNSKSPSEVHDYTEETVPLIGTVVESQDETIQTGHFGVDTLNDCEIEYSDVSTHKEVDMETCPGFFNETEKLLDENSIHEPNTLTEATEAAPLELNEDKKHEI